MSKSSTENSFSMSSNGTTGAPNIESPRMYTPSIVIATTSRPASRSNRNLIVSADSSPPKRISGFCLIVDLCAQSSPRGRHLAVQHVLGKATDDGGGLIARRSGHASLDVNVDQLLRLVVADERPQPG